MTKQVNTLTLTAVYHVSCYLDDNKPLHRSTALMYCSCTHTQRRAFVSVRFNGWVFPECECGRWWHRHTHIQTLHGSRHFFPFACASLAVIRAKRQQAGVEEQERESAAHSWKWEDVTAPLGFGLPGGKHRLIESNLCC